MTYLDRWRRELRRGKRTTHTFDPLWQAACRETWAEEAERDQLLETAHAYRESAQKVMGDTNPDQPMG